MLGNNVLRNPIVLFSLVAGLFGELSFAETPALSELARSRSSNSNEASFNVLISFVLSGTGTALCTLMMATKHMTRKNHLLFCIVKVARRSPSTGYKKIKQKKTHLKITW
uniref:Uncharacterized protein n=1 Tax=Cacopsylla melanoneura TaxID=428564 RepID=A0A8D8Q8P1_9HEMI